MRSRVVDRLVDWRARRIRDPIERLAYLRRAMGGPPSVLRSALRPLCWLAVTLAALALLSPRDLPKISPKAFPKSAAQPAIPATQPSVWLVERAPESELYSNGLRIDNQFQLEGPPRLYPAFPRIAKDRSRWRWRTEPVGIVYHSSEGEVASFEPEYNGVLQQQRLGLLEYARRHRLYHFIVDRFGQVHRVVEEGARADHAGHSVWADAEWIYVNLNSSFLGVCFEAQTAGEGLTPAQVHAGKVLTEMLRARYGLPAGNCVTHAQVSVNPGNFRAGYHTDWAGGFPFAGLGLPENQEQPTPSLSIFGFDCDPPFLELAGPHLRKGMALAEEQIRQAASADGIPIARYRADLRKQYWNIAAASRSSFRPPQ